MVIAVRSLPRFGLATQIGAITMVVLLAVVWQSTRVPEFIDLWLTPDQQGMRAFNNRDWGRAVERFRDPAWLGVAAYYGGRYEDAAAAFGRIPSAEGYFNRGDALMKGRDYRNAIAAFELAVQQAPEWQAARENLELARYVQSYLEATREQSDTEDESEMSADEVQLDNKQQGGREIEITRASALGLESAEKWMRAVDTATADFLRTRFAIELTHETSR